ALFGAVAEEFFVGTSTHRRPNELYSSLSNACFGVGQHRFNRAALQANACIADRSSRPSALPVLSICSNSIVVCVARESRWFTKWQRWRITNKLRGGRLRRCSGKLETLLRGSVSVMEFILTRFRIFQS